MKFWVGLALVILPWAVGIAYACRTPSGREMVKIMGALMIVGGVTAAFMLAGIHLMGTSP